MARLSVSLLGAIKVSLNEKPLTPFKSNKALALLVYLMVGADQPHRRGRLAGLFWPDHSERAARHTLSQTLLRLYKIIGRDDASPPFLLASRQTIQFNPESDYWLDVAAFVRQANLAADQANHNPNFQALHQVVDLYRGDFLEQFYLADSGLFDEWVLVKREQLRQLALKALDQLTVYYEQQADYGLAQHYARRQVEMEPYREDGHRRLMQALALSGQRGPALAQYKTCRQLLVEELGLEPTAETTALYRQIQAGELGPHEPEATQVISDLAKKASTSFPVAPAPDLPTTLSRLAALPGGRLFGVEAVQTQLQTMLHAADGPWLIALQGLGGIGKTSLAQAVVWASLSAAHFYDIAWINAWQEQLQPEGRLEPVSGSTLSAETFVDVLLEQLDPNLSVAQAPQKKVALLTRWLKTNPYLVVIDNLETGVDYQSLLPLLHQLAKPTKFLLTSRHSLREYSHRVYCLTLPSLNRVDAQALLKYEAQRRGMATLAEAQADQLDQIYEVTGGNPLALKLVVGHLERLPLARVLGKLRQSHDKSIEALYSYIYWHSWEVLDAAGKRLLVAMPLAQDGTFADLARESELAEADLGPALKQLITLSLLEVGGDIEQPRYRIHRLTETFLLKFIQSDSQTGAETFPKTTPYVDFFQQRVGRSLDHWRVHLSAQGSGIMNLAHNRRHITRAISFALVLPQVWPAARGLIEVLAPSMEQQGYWDSWQNILSRARAMSQRANDRAGEVLISALSARLLIRQSHYEEAINSYWQTVDLARQNSDRFNEARAYSNLGYLYLEQGHLWRAEVLCCHALTIFKQLKSRHGQAHTENHLGLLYLDRYLWAEARQHLERACALWQAIPDPNGLMRGYINLGILYNAMKQPDQALDYLEKAQEQARLSGEVAEIGTIDLQTGIAQRLRGNLTQAESYTRQAEAVFKRFFNPAGLTRSLGHLGSIYFAQQKWTEAISYLEAALTSCDNLEDRITILMDMVAYGQAKELLAKTAAYFKKLEATINQYGPNKLSPSVAARVEQYRRQLGEQKIT